VQSNRPAFKINLYFKYYVARVFVYCIVCDVNIIFLQFFICHFFSCIALWRVTWHANVNVIQRDDVESSSPYRLVSIQSKVSLRRLPIRVFESSFSHDLTRFAFFQPKRFKVLRGVQLIIYVDKIVQYCQHSKKVGQCSTFSRQKRSVAERKIYGSNVKPKVNTSADFFFNTGNSTIAFGRVRF
jgi:hypothetical protein